MFSLRSIHMPRLTLILGLTHTLLTPNTADATTAAVSDLSEYETFLPQSVEASISNRERTLLVDYLDHPNDGDRAAELVRFHLKKLYKHIRKGAKPGKILRRSILGLYFAERARDLGYDHPAIDDAIEFFQDCVDSFEDPNTQASNHEQRPAHKFFRRAFHFEEGLRYKAEKKLLNEYVREPNNVYTAFAFTALKLWTGGEAPYDDPTMLYDFVLGSYFSLRTITLARELEERWVQDPENNERFRMASILGGFSALQRRWLAVLHGDDAARQAIDDEHREWRLIHRSFHAFTVGIPFFEEPENFLEGMFAVTDGFDHCSDEPVRTCLNRPRFFFNRLGFTLILIDFLIKAGQLEAAQATLQARFAPDEQESWANWDLGQGPWLHREQNLEAIAELYQNGDPEDDPLHFQMRRKKWSTNTTTCQTCHQTQSKTWTYDEFETVLMPPPGVATVGQWPEISTRWYGSL